MPNDPSADEEQPVFERLSRKLARRRQRARENSHSSRPKRDSSNNLAMYGGSLESRAPIPIATGSNYAYMPIATYIPPSEQLVEVQTKLPSRTKATKKQKRTKRGQTPLWYVNALVELRNNPGLSNRAIAARIGVHVSNFSKEPHKSAWEKAQKMCKSQLAETPSKDQRFARKSLRYENAANDD